MKPLQGLRFVSFAELLSNVDLKATQARHHKLFAARACVDNLQCYRPPRPHSSDTSTRKCSGVFIKAIFIQINGTVLYFRARGGRIYSESPSRFCNQNKSSRSTSTPLGFDRGRPFAIWKLHIGDSKTPLTKQVLPTGIVDLPYLRSSTSILVSILNIGQETTLALITRPTGLHDKKGGADELWKWIGHW